MPSTFCRMAPFSSTRTDRSFPSSPRLTASVGDTCCRTWMRPESPGRHPSSTYHRPMRRCSGRDFSRVLSVVELDDGRVLATDQIENSIYVIDLQSGDVRTEGSSGEGPGEYGQRRPPVSARWRFHGLLVGQPPRLLLLAGDTIVQTLDPVYPRLGMGATGEPPWGVDRAGRVLGISGFAYQPRSGWSRTHADSLLVLLSTGSIFDEGTSGADTIARVGGQGRWGVGHVSTVAQMGGREVTMNSTLTSPLASEGQAWLFADGWVALAHPDPYRVDWQTPAGQWVRGAPLPVTPTDVTLEEQCLAIRRAAPNAQCDPDRYPGWPRQVPPFTMVLDRGWVTPGGTALQSGPHGLLLIRRTPTTNVTGDPLRRGRPGRGAAGDHPDAGWSQHRRLRARRRSTSCRRTRWTC